MSSVLVAGERRLRAVKLLGWTEIPVNIIDLEAVTRGEFAENAVRKDFTLSESDVLLDPVDET
jgi:ParB-like chromosome segregation protein Spo0J